MKTTDLMTIVTVALATASITVMTFWSGSLNAGSDGDQLTTQIAKPMLVSNGIETSMATAGGRTFGAGDVPTFELTAVNTTGEAVTTSVRIAMTASSPADMLSRVPRLPSTLWQQDQPLVLQPNETRTFAIPAAAKLPANSMIAVSLRDANPTPATADATATQAAPHRGGSPQSGIVAMNFSTTAPAVLTASAE